MNLPIELIDVKPPISEAELDAALAGAANDVPLGEPCLLFSQRELDLLLANARAAERAKVLAEVAAGVLAHPATPDGEQR